MQHRLMVLVIKIKESVVMGILLRGVFIQAKI